MDRVGILGIWVFIVLILMVVDLCVSAFRDAIFDDRLTRLEKAEERRRDRESCRPRPEL